MKWDKNYFYIIVIAVLIFVLLLQRCGDGGRIKPKNDTITTIILKYDTIVKQIPTYTPKWNTKIIRDTTYLKSINIDTSYVLGDYYSTYYYKDTIKDSTLTLYINDSVSENKIKSRKPSYKFVKLEKTINNVVLINKNEFYVGLGLVGSKSGINFFGPELLLRTKGKQVYGVGVGIDGDIQPTLSLRTYWKIGKK
jgi:hypothetical protein